MNKIAPELKKPEHITRRAMVTWSLFGLGAGSAGIVSGLCLPHSAFGADPKPVDIAAAKQIEGACRLLPEAVEGPYYFDPKLVRQDIRDGRQGREISLVLKVIDGTSCQPLEDVRVDVWHADARGVYSGYDSQGDKRDISAKGEDYLRGTQMSQADGVVRFTTIYPGWYPGRTPHIHVKLFLDNMTLLTGQIYFPDELSQRIYSSFEPYIKRPVSDTRNSNDWLFQSATKEGGGIVMTVDSDEDALVASLVIAVDKTGQRAGALRSWWRRLFQG